MEPTNNNEEERNLRYVFYGIMLILVGLMIAVAVGRSQDFQTEEALAANAGAGCVVVDVDHRFVWGHGPGSVGLGVTVDGPGVVEVVEVVTDDVYASRASTVPQTSESVRVTAGGAGSAVSPDLADRVGAASWRGSLGSFRVGEGSHGVDVVHVPSGLSPDSVRVVSVCVSFTPDPPVTTTVPVPASTTSMVPVPSSIVDVPSSVVDDVVPPRFTG